MTMTKLSNALRRGAKKHKQGFDDYTVEIDGELCTCAWGAIAVGKIRKAHPTEEEISALACNLYTEYDGGPPIACPICTPLGAPGHNSLADTIASLNDKHHWTREQIADWLQEQGY